METGWASGMHGRKHKYILHFGGGGGEGMSRHELKKMNLSFNICINLF